MAVEPVTSVNRQVVPITWDVDKLDGELVRIRCTNTETLGVSETGVSKNDGTGIISYPLGYAGTTYVEVIDNHANVDSGFISVDGQGNASVPEVPDTPPDVPPIEAPPEEGGGDEHPAHPIVEVPEES